MSEQLYQLKSKSLNDKEATEAVNDTKLDFEYADKVQKDKMVELLKRNHDVMMEKYEVYSERNKTLEKKALEKEQLYVTIKSENETLANQLYQVKRQAEDYRQEKQILESKFNTAESLCKQATEQAASLKTTKEQLEGQLKVVNEQVELVQKSHDTLAAKKQNETDLLSKEVNLLGIREREGKNLVLHHERELGEIKDLYRTT